VIPAYMGLIKQIDDQLGRLFDFLAERGRHEDTMIVFTSDHGDYLGDHWLGEKDFLHDVAVKIPLLVYDPSPEADATRGSVCDAPVESIDVLPTFVEWYGGETQPNRLEGRSLLPWLRGGSAPVWRRFAISEYDYSMMEASAALGVSPRNARMYMAADRRWKYIEIEGFRPLLFDRWDDPAEVVDRGADPEYDAPRRTLAGAIARWARRGAQRTTVSDAQILSRRGRSAQRGILIGFWDESELPEDVAAFRNARARSRLAPSSG
jgi:arylsulfatase A-like enzyme